MAIDKEIKQYKFTDAFHKAMINLFYTSNYFRDAHMSVFHPFKIQGQHFNVLRILKGKHPLPVSPGYIKEVMLDKGRDLTRLIDKLVVLGWVNRNVCPENKRRMNISLTINGLKAVEIISLEVHKQGSRIKVSHR